MKKFISQKLRGKGHVQWSNWTYINNRLDPEFKTTIIRDWESSGTEKAIEDSKESLTTDIKDLITSQT